MSEYINIPVNHEDFTMIIFALQERALKADAFFEVHDIVSLIDRLQDEYDKKKGGD